MHGSTVHTFFPILLRILRGESNIDAIVDTCFVGVTEVTPYRTRGLIGSHYIPEADGRIRILPMALTV